MEEDGGEGVEGVASTTAILKTRENKIPGKPKYQMMKRQSSRRDGAKRGCGCSSSVSWVFA